MAGSAVLASASPGPAVRPPAVTWPVSFRPLFCRGCWGPQGDGCETLGTVLGHKISGQKVLLTLVLMMMIMMMIAIIIDYEMSRSSPYRLLLRLWYEQHFEALSSKGSVDVFPSGFLTGPNACVFHSAGWLQVCV